MFLWCLEELEKTNYRLCMVLRCMFFQLLFKCPSFRKRDTRAVDVACGAVPNITPCRQMFLQLLSSLRNIKLRNESPHSIVADLFRLERAKRREHVSLAVSRKEAEVKQCLLVASPDVRKGT